MSEAPSPRRAGRSVPFDLHAAPLAPGRHLIEASAGTGKTYSIVGLVVRAVLDGRADDLTRLLVVTFTVAATEELRTRIRTALRHAVLQFEERPGVDRKLAPLLRRFAARYAESPEARALALRRLRRALGQVDEAAVFTIHGFCKRVLEEAAFESGTSFSPEFVEDGSDLLGRAATDLWHRHGYHDALLAAIVVEQAGDETSLLDHYYNTYRYPNTRIVPSTQSLETARAVVKEAVEALREGWERETMEAVFAGMDWNKNAPLGDAARERTLDRLEAVLAERWAGNLDAVRPLTAAGIADHAAKTSKARKARIAEVQEMAPIVLCTRLGAALDGVRASFREGFIRRLRTRYDELKEAAGVLTFDDLLHRLHAALHGAGGEALAARIHDAYDLVLVDEFQDTDPVQYGIFRKAFAERPVFLIGDPKQAIYSFRGADVFAYLEAQSEAGTRYALDTNWRSGRRLVEAVNRLFGRHPSPFVFEAMSFDDVRAHGAVDAAPLGGDDLPPWVWWYVDETTKGAVRDLIDRTLVSEIGRLLGGGMRIGDRPLGPRDIAVLVRTNAEAERVQAALRDVGVPAVISKSGDVMKSAEMADLERVLHAIARPQDGRALRAALATEVWGWDAEAIEGLAGDDAAWGERVAALHAWRRLWQRHGVLHVLQHVLDAEGVTQRLLGFADGERRMTNVRHCIELLHEAEAKQDLSPEEMLRWLGARHTRAQTKGKEAELRLETDAEAVQITTIHGSKGLEYEVVMCPSLWDARPVDKGKNHLAHHPDGVVYDLGSDDLDAHLLRAEAERLSEDLRLAYVAVTRAKHRCYVAWGPVKSADASALGYLLHTDHVTGIPDPSAYVKACKSTASVKFKQTRATIDALAAEHPEVFGVRDARDIALHPTQARIGTPGGDGAPRLRPRYLNPAAAARLAPWSMGSYSTWTRPDGEAPTHTPIGSRERAGEEAESAGEMLGFVGGASAGLCLHEILQHVDLSEVDGDAARQQVERILRKHGLHAPERHPDLQAPAETVRTMLSRLAVLPLPGASFTLGDVSRRRSLPEWRFVLPVDGVAPSALAASFRTHARGALSESYPAALQGLSDETARGFMVGIVDLVFEHEGRWYIADWKSDWLGNFLDDYAPDPLREAVLAHHYALQYHLYVVGLHRYLKQRLPGYSYDAHFGGAWYVFLRGLDEDRGLYFDRPPAALVDALEAQICGNVTSARTSEPVEDAHART